MDTDDYEDRYDAGKYLQGARVMVEKQNAV